MLRSLLDWPRLLNLLLLLWPGAGRVPVPARDVVGF